MRMTCLLCDSKNVIIKETHPIEDLKSIWRPFMDISEELKVDTLHLYQCNNCRLNFFDTLLAGGDKFYSELSNLDWYYKHDGKTEYDYVQKFIKKDDKVLDVGAGIGILATKIKEKVDFTGLELSTKAVDIAHKSGINVIQEDLNIHAQNNKATYDTVCLFQVLEHLTELDNFLKSIHLTLKSKGYFVVAVPNNDGFISQSPNYTFNLPPHHTILWTEETLRFLAQKYSFDVVDIEIELLQDVHRDYAYRSYYIYNIKRAFFLPSLLMDKGLSHRIITRIVNAFFSNNLIKNSLNSYASKKQKQGQSIFMVLQKK
jgi:2-polyprenyl-3-methyl-5-hydroxy-6-metoxy-1,4-benzoquinol methylase